MVQEFKDKVAIVTGGSKGIGFGIAQVLAQNGAYVHLVARTQEDLEKAQAKIGEKAEIHQADITDFPAIQKVIDSVYEQRKRLDIFINNAGEWKSQSFDTPRDEVESFRELIRDAPGIATEYLIRKFKGTEQELQILTVVSQAGLGPMPNNLGYNAKLELTARLMALQKQLDTESIDNIRLYGVYPATVGTESALEAFREGKLQDPTSLESVIDTATDLLLEKIPTRHAYIGYIPDRGILRRYFAPPKTILHQLGDDEIIDANFNPETLKS